MHENAPILAERRRDTPGTGNSTAKAAAAIATDFNARPQHLERHFTVSELAEVWQISPDSVTRLFEGEPGIFDPQPTPRSRRRRRKRNLRIPESVAARVYRRMTVPNGGR